MKHNNTLIKLKTYLKTDNMINKIINKILIFFYINFGYFIYNKSSKKDYIKSVKCNLDCNNSVDCKFVLYNYTNKQIDDNKSYFYHCRKMGTSPYYALLFFNDYLENRSK